MAINFDSLPKKNPMGSVTPGLYYATIEKAEMKQGKEASKPPYLNVTYQLLDRDGKKAGKMFDIFCDSDNNVIQYKIGRFVRACGIPLTGTMELKDIGKVILGRKIVVDTKEKEYNGNKSLEVNLFDREGYYTEEEFEEIYGLINDGEAAGEAANEAFKQEQNIPEDTDETTDFMAGETTSAPENNASETGSAEY